MSDELTAKLSTWTNEDWAPVIKQLAADTRHYRTERDQARQELARLRDELQTYIVSLKQYRGDEKQIHTVDHTIADLTAILDPDVVTKNVTDPVPTRDT